MGRSQVRSTVRWESIIIAVFGTTLGLAIGTFFGWAIVRAMADEGIDTLTVPVDQPGGRHRDRRLRRSDGSGDAGPPGRQARRAEGARHGITLNQRPPRSRRCVRKRDVAPPRSARPARRNHPSPYSSQERGHRHDLRDPARQTHQPITSSSSEGGSRDNLEAQHTRPRSQRPDHASGNAQFGQPNRVLGDPRSWRTRTAATRCPNLRLCRTEFLMATPSSTLFVRQARRSHGADGPPSSRVP